LLLCVVFAFIAELPFIYFPNSLDAVGLFGGFVISDAGDSCKAQRHFAFVFGALLNFVVGDFNDDSWNDDNAMTFLADGRVL